MCLGKPLYLSLSNRAKTTLHIHVDSGAIPRGAEYRGQLYVATKRPHVVGSERLSGAKPLCLFAAEPIWLADFATSIGATWQVYLRKPRLRLG